MAKKILIVLDPGHYPNYNKGVAPGYYEGNKMYNFTEFEKAALESFGFDVIVTRSRSKDMALYSRGQVAVKNGKKYDITVFISNHSNAGAASAKGVEAYRSLYLPKSADLGEALCKTIADVMNTKNRGLKTRQGNNGDYYGVIRGAVSGAKSTAAAEKGVVDFAFLVEHGFHTNKEDCAFLNDDINLKALANAEAKTIADYFGMKKEAPKPAAPITKPKTNADVKAWQKAAIADGFSKLLPSGADGLWGKECEAVAKEAVCMYRNGVYKYKSLTKFVQKKAGLKGTAIDGLFGKNTEKAVAAYQKKVGLTADGKAGKNTYKTMCNVK